MGQKDVIALYIAFLLLSGSLKACQSSLGKDRIGCRGGQTLPTHAEVGRTNLTQGGSLYEQGEWKDVLSLGPTVQTWGLVICSAGGYRKPRDQAVGAMPCGQHNGSLTWLATVIDSAPGPWHGQQWEHGDTSPTYGSPRRNLKPDCSEASQPTWTIMQQPCGSPGWYF